jgi:hypothetical protein
VSAHRAIVAVALVVALAGCTRGQRDACRGKAQARCAWQDAVAQEDPDAPARDPDGSAADDPDAQDRPFPERAVLARVADLMAEGMGPDVVVTAALGYCAQAAATTDDGTTRTCPLRGPGESGVVWSLEIRGDAVTLSALGLDGPQAQALWSSLRDRWARRCREPFAPIGGEEAHRELVRCSFGDGPVLVLGRFPRDLEADLWQVSLAVVSAT